MSPFATTTKCDSTALAVGECGQTNKGSSPNMRQSVVAIGTDSGDLLVHNVAANRDAVYPLADEKCAVVAIACVPQSPYVVAVTANSMLHLVDMSKQSVRRNIPVARGAVSVAARLVQDEATMYVVVGAVVSAVYRLRPESHQDAQKMEKLSTFSGHSSAPDFVWLAANAKCVVSCQKSEAVVRIWNLGGSGRCDRCVRSLPCATRVAQVLCHEPSSTVVCTTLSGTVNVFQLNVLCPSFPDPLPVSPTARYVSATPKGRMLAAAVAPSTNNRVLLIRGQFAAPSVELGPELPADRLAASAETTEVPFNSTTSKALEATPSLAAVGSQGTGAVAEAGAFAEPSVYHAEDMTKVPIAAGEGIGAGGISVPLYQALHANDTSMVIELVDVASRTSADLAATIHGMDIRYLLQLLKILCERLAYEGARSPLHAWVCTILSLRGMELVACETESVRRSADPSSPSTALQPSAFVAPILHQYRQYVALHNRLATCYGRLSIFESVRPHKKNSNFANVFKERPKSGTIVSVRGRSSRVASNKQRRKVRMTNDEALEEEAEESAEGEEEAEEGEPLRGIAVAETGDSSAESEEGEDEEDGSGEEKELPEGEKDAGSEAEENEEQQEESNMRDAGLLEGGEQP